MEMKIPDYPPSLEEGGSFCLSKIRKLKSVFFLLCLNCYFLLLDWHALHLGAKESIYA